MNEQEKRIAGVVEAYDAQGWHRTGTEVDVASGEWLAAALRDSGVEAAGEPYALDRVAVRQAFIEVGGRRIDGLPLFDGGFTGAKGMRGRLGTEGSGAGLLLLSTAGEGEAQRLEAIRATDAAQAIIAVTAGRRPGLMAHNATHFTKPFGPPVLQVSSEEGTWLEKEARAGAEALLVVETDRVPAESANVVGHRPGADPALAPVVVTTPRSGWWHCASERGGGIAAWLETARIVASSEPARPVWFVAFSGHEIGHFGCDAFVARRPEMVTLAKVWVHFGANVGGATEIGVRVGASTQEHLALATKSLAARSVSGVTTAPPGRVLGLEPQALAALGGRCISLLGGNAFFHLESDRWPQAVDVGSVARQANAIGDLVLQLATAD